MDEKVAIRMTEQSEAKREHDLDVRKERKKLMARRKYVSGWTPPKENK